MRSRLALACLAAFLTLAPLATAEPSLADKETARVLFKEGDEKFRAGDYQGALKAFAAADALMGVPTTRLERGRALQMLGRLLEAREVLLGVARIPVDPSENEVQQKARDEAARLAETIASLIPSLRVQVRGVPEGTPVTMSIDDTDVPQSAQGFPRKVDPGEHVVKVSAVGYRATRRTIAVKEGDETELAIQLEPGTTPMPDAEPEPEPEPDPSTGSGGGISPLVPIGFGVGGAGLLVGAICGGITLARVSDLEDRGCPDCDPTQVDDSELDDDRVIAHVATAGFVIAGVGVAVGIVGIVLSASSSDDTALVLGPGNAAVRGSF
jgi:PEGA domain-containing protein